MQSAGSQPSRTPQPEAGKGDEDDEHEADDAEHEANESEDEDEDEDEIDPQPKPPEQSHPDPRDRQETTFQSGPAFVRRRGGSDTSFYNGPGTCPLCNRRDCIGHNSERRQRRHRSYERPDGYWEPWHTHDPDPYYPEVYYEFGLPRMERSDRYYDDSDSNCSSCWSSDSD